MKPGQIDLFTKRVRQAPAAPEFLFHVMIADILANWAAPGWMHTHLPMGEYRTAATAGRLKRMGVRPGWPDFILLSPNGVPHFLEVKRKGGKLSEHQIVFAEWCRCHGCPFACVDNFEQALGQLKTWGAVKVRIAGFDR
jgi:hypothetical protein